MTNYAWLYDFQRTLGPHVNWSSILAYPDGSTTAGVHREKLADHTARVVDAGADVWAQVTCRPITPVGDADEPTAVLLGARLRRRSSPHAPDDGPICTTTRLASASPTFDEPQVLDPARWDMFTVAETVAHPELVGQSVADDRGT